MKKYFIVLAVIFAIACLAVPTHAKKSNTCKDYSKNCSGKQN